jgi:hypothetical protein
VLWNVARITLFQEAHGDEEQSDAASEQAVVSSHCESPTPTLLPRDLTVVGVGGGTVEKKSLKETGESREAPTNELTCGKNL